MRAAPPLTLDIPRQTGWRVVRWLLVLLAGLSLGAWLWQGEAVATDAAHWVVASAAVLGLLAGLGRVDATPCRLSWDGRTWAIADPAGPAQLPVPGRLRVMIDLSVAMLLRFEPEGGPAAGRRGCWIPVGGRRLPPAQWQALRRTVYSAPLHAGGSPGGDGPRTE